MIIFRIKEIRKNKNVTGYKLAKLCGMSRSYLCDLENNRRFNPSLEKLLEIASKKSKTTALWVISNMMKYPQANTLVIRKTFRTLKDSCFTELKWAIHRLQVDEWWEIKESPLEMIYKPTGQKIYFRGLDDPLKVTSVTVDVGVLCWLWIEEAYEIMKEADFDVIDESIRRRSS
jgi:PBSX family phage terminase large subunit